MDIGNVNRLFVEIEGKQNFLEKALDSEYQCCLCGVQEMLISNNVAFEQIEKALGSTCSDIYFNLRGKLFELKERNSQLEVRTSPTASVANTPTDSPTASPPISPRISRLTW